MIKKLKRGLTTPPSRAHLLETLGLLLLLLPLALAIGFVGGLFELKLLEARPLVWIAFPVAALIVPSLIEEALFRGVLLPSPDQLPPKRRLLIQAGLALFCYVAWHPLYALMVPELDIPLLDPTFLAIVLLLGLLCSWCYLRSGSLWVAVFLHWISVVVWVLFLGGRNPLLPYLQRWLS